MLDLIVNIPLVGFGYILTECLLIVEDLISPTEEILTQMQIDTSVSDVDLSNWDMEIDTSVWDVDLSGWDIDSVLKFVAYG